MWEKDKRAQREADAKDVKATDNAILTGIQKKKEAMRNQQHP